MGTNRYSSATTLYRTLDEGPITDFSVHPGQRRQRGRAQHGDGDRQASASHWSAVRRRQPVAEPLPATFKWLARLPADVRPLQLLREFPRIANALAANWGDAPAFRACLYELLMDRRGNRRGFQQPLLSELLALRSYFESSRF